MMMKKNRVFKVGKNLIRVFKWVTPKRRNSCKYRKLEGQTKPKSKSTSKLCKWGSSIRRGFFFFSSINRGYIRVGHDPVVNTKPNQIPKGHLALYVGESENNRMQIVVPVLFLNHPLFGELLKEAGHVYGFHNPGRITIPCSISEFQTVQATIAAVGKCRSLIHRRGFVSGVKCL